MLRKHTSDISKQHFDNGILNGGSDIGKGQFSISVTRYRFLINIEKSVLQPTQKIELLGIENDSEEMTLKLPQGKKGSDCTPVLTHFGDVISYHKGVDPTDRVPYLSSTATAILQAPLQLCVMQRQLILVLSHDNNFNS